MKWLLLGILFQQAAFAEYRVYQFFVKPRYNFLQENPSYLVTSSLDPTTYIAYHGGTQNIDVDLVRTWMCPGHTGDKKQYCASPYKKMVNP